jgi:hypothetical protein
MGDPQLKPKSFPDHHPDLWLPCPKTHRETHTVFFDYHASRRAFLDEVYFDDDGNRTMADGAPLPAETPSRPVPAWAEGW